MKETILDIENTLRLLLNERRRLLQEAGVAEELLDADLYRDVRNLKQKVNYRDKVIKKKDKRIKELESEVVLLKQISGEASKPITTSNNSGLPSSKNPIGIKHTQSLRQPSCKKVGGQKGHVGITRLQTSTPDESELCHVPINCPICGKSLSDCEPSLGEVRQMIDLPAVVVPHIKEFIQLQVTCKCGHNVKGEFPKEVTGTVCYGPTVEATVAYLSTLQDIPFKRLTDLMGNLFGLAMSPGTISNILTRMRKKAQVFYEEIRQAIENSPVVGADESGINVNGKNNWLWTFQTDYATYLVMDERRGKSVINKSFPNGFPNSTLVTDRWVSYFSLEVKDHQICLAHLLRNTIYFVEYLPKKKWPKQMLQLLRDSIHERKTNGVSDNKDGDFKVRFDKLIEEPIDLKNKKKQDLFDTFRNGLAKHRENIFTFLTNPLVPYDNNGSERSIRPAKTKIKVSGQFKTFDGAQNYATLLSIIQTAKKSDKDPLQALLDVANYRES